METPAASEHGTIPRLIYLISAQVDQLYANRHQFRGRNMSYGQLSFIYDFALAGARTGINLHLVVENLSQFSLAKSLAGIVPMHEAGLFETRGWDHSVVVVDVVTEELLQAVPQNVPLFCMVHNAGCHYPGTWVARIDKFLCMSETSVSSQALRMPLEKLALIHQGVDLQRFQPGTYRPFSRTRPEALIYGRLEEPKIDTFFSVIECLLEKDMELTVLGGGDGFWRINDSFGTDLLVINHIPCQSIHRFLPRYDLVVSSGRGVMEALACDIPVLCAGYRYAGLVGSKNVVENRKVNMTGFGLAVDYHCIQDDLVEARRVASGVCRNLAEKYFSMTEVVETVAGLARELHEKHRARVSNSAGCGAPACHVEALPPLR